jgi:hypothetical protein
LLNFQYHKIKERKRKLQLTLVSFVTNAKGGCLIMHTLPKRSISLLNNPQNNEMKFLSKYQVDMLKIIIIIVGYILNNFIIHITML